MRLCRSVHVSAIELGSNIYENSGERNMTLLYNNIILNDGYRTDLGPGVGAVGSPQDLVAVCEITHDYETNSLLYYVYPQSVDLITSNAFQS